MVTLIETARILAYDHEGKAITEDDVQNEMFVAPEPWMPILQIMGLPPEDYEGDPDEWGLINQVKLRRRGPPESASE